MEKMLLLRSAIVVSILAFAGADAIGCLDYNGDPIDWFVLYKLPENEESPDPLVQQGVAFLYMDAKNQKTWMKSSVGIDANSGHAVASTLDQIYDSQSPQNQFRLMYNDEKPTGEVSFTHGHTKGVLLFDGQSGFWLVHSTPKFPPADAYAWPESAHRYGQSFLCVSYGYSFLKNIAVQLSYNYPFVYDANLPDQIAADIPILKKVVAGSAVRLPALSNKVSLTSAAGTSFVSYAKGRKFNKDLYFDLVAPSLDLSLYTETWRNGPGDLPSECTSQIKVQNIQKVKLPGNEFETSHDHSKWAVSQDPGAPYICIGDINRQEGQFKRGGGTVCFVNKNIWLAYSNAAEQEESCPHSDLIEVEIDYINT